MPRILAVLAVTQVVAWGVIGFPAVLAPAIAADLRMPLPAVFAGTSVMSVVTALASPVFGPLFVRLGARFMMMAGALTAAPGLALIAVSTGPIVYFVGWLLIGLGGAAMLTTGAHIYLAERDGAAARGPISGLMVMTGLSSAVFLPLTGLLSDFAGWRWTCAIFAVLLGALNPLLCLIALPPTQALSSGAAQPAKSARTPVRWRVFGMIAGAIALNGFATFGITAVTVQMFITIGYDQRAAIALGSAISVVQVGARAVDLVSSRLMRRTGDGLPTAAIATALIPIGLLILVLGAGRPLVTGLFVMLYGVASGILAVARSTIPLAFYSGPDYARVLSRIGLPLNLTVAASPPLMAWLLEDFGLGAMVTVALSACCGACAMLVALASQRNSRPVRAFES
ncbi:MAG: MFS transporter [Xanthobacteraceae bacterium]|nr:MFS transporter [Xanthobacteraceae bacterium]MBY0611667.1 MFS transporter [Beijerinckiaceae bacterium]